MRVAQPVGQRGSLKWIQRLVESDRRDLLPVKLKDVRWVSPLAEDDWAEYRDRAFLKKVNQEALGDKLSDFWPDRGPQWDALGLVNGVPLLVEAKAHVREFFSPETQATGPSRAKIVSALTQAAEGFGANHPDFWPSLYFQYANRLAHLWFFHQNGVKAHLLFVSFLGDVDMAGPNLAETWETAFASADYALGIRRSKLKSGFVHHAMPTVSELEQSKSS
ncbi:MAG: hypothetical protein KJO42_14620 [Silicimonas sp.]|nr:hypothetical protein [Silicimonas sp.]